MRTILLSIIFILVFSSCNEMGKKSQSNTRTDEKEIVKNNTFKPYNFQVFPDFDFKIKCPAELEDVTDEGEVYCEAHFVGFEGDTFYQIIITRIPAGDWTEVDGQDGKSYYIEKTMGLFDNGRSVTFDYEKYPAFLFDDYMHEGNRGRAIAVERGKFIYTFNVISESNLDKEFNKFTNSVRFL